MSESSSITARPTTLILGVWVRAMDSISGSSTMQGPHQVPQKFTTVQCLRLSESETVLPSGDLRENSGALKLLLTVGEIGLGVGLALLRSKR